MRMMKKRTTRPKNNKYYIRKANGGYNGAVKGYPTISGADVLCNCFGGETRYVTDEGLKSFYDTVGTVQNVLNENGEFVPAEIKAFGVQKLYKVTFNNGYEVYATENHRWVVDRFSYYKGKKYAKRKIKTTLELNDADYIPYNYYDGNGLLCKEGIVHGIVFGDGCKNSNASTYQVQLFGNKTELKKYLPEHIRSDYNLKEVPSIYESEEYLRGFVAGLLATDGTVTDDTFKISSVDAEALKQIENICYKVGIHTGGIYAETRDVSIGKYEYTNHTIYYLTLKRKGIECLLLKSADRAKISSEFKDVKYTRVKRVEATNRCEEVYCAVEPITHTITLEHNILTGQCVGYANGRFNEIGKYGKCKYQLVCNAENFIESAKKQGLTISKKPTLGGIMVWQKGKTLGGGDGAGHVAVVEQIKSDGSIVTSESGWNGWAFKLVSRTNSNGRWGQASGYKFRGCIVNPAVKAVTTTAAVKATTYKPSKPYTGKLPSKKIKKGSKGTEVKYLQRFLNWCLGIKLSVDGKCGTHTTNAIKKYQKTYGLKTDGIFGSQSLKKAKGIVNQYAEKKPSEAKKTASADTKKSTAKKQTNADKIIAKAKELRGDKNKRTSAYKKALDKAFPNRSSWGTAARYGRSCDVFVATVLRATGLYKNCPRGLRDMYKAKPKNFKRLVYKNVRPRDVSKTGDIIIYKKSKGSNPKGHTCIRTKNGIYQANHPKYYPHYTKGFKKLETKRPEVIIWRAK